MGSQRHKLEVQSFTAAGEVIAQGTLSPGYLLQTAPPATREGEEPLAVEVPMGAPGGPLQGSSLAGPIHEDFVPPDTTPGPSGPLISGISPPSTPVDTPVQVTISGTNFTEDCVVEADDGQLVSAFVSATEMTADVPGIATAGPITIVVVDAVTLEASPGVPFDITDGVEMAAAAAVEERAFPIGPFGITSWTYEDDKFGYSIAYDGEGIESGDTVLIEASGSSEVNGEYFEVEVVDGAVFIPLDVPARAPTGGRITVTGAA